MYSNMSSLNRHLLDAYFAWFHENGLGRINVLCYAEPIGCAALGPMTQNGMVTLNISPKAVRNFRYTDTGLSFKMSIKGIPTEVDVPFYALHSITLPTTENIVVPGDFPPVEILLHQLLSEPEEVMLRALIGEPEADIAFASSNEGELPPGSFAVFQPFTNPTASIQVPPAAQVKDEPKPLLDFGHYGGGKIPLKTQPASRYKGKPTLTVIQGGKQD